MAALAAEPQAELKLDLEGMSCASCAARIEKRLNKLEGVEATVNFATEQATVRKQPDVAVDELVAAVEAAGYKARLAEPPQVDELDAHHHHDEPLRLLTRRLIVAAGLTVPVALLAMVPPLRFAGSEWLALALSTPLVF
jgi:Cu+-exporting ATPase